MKSSGTAATWQPAANAALAKAAPVVTASAFAACRPVSCAACCHPSGVSQPFSIPAPEQTVTCHWSNPSRSATSSASSAPMHDAATIAVPRADAASGHAFSPASIWQSFCISRDSVSPRSRSVTCSGPAAVYPFRSSSAGMYAFGHPRQNRENSASDSVSPCSPRMRLNTSYRIRRAPSATVSISKINTPRIDSPAFMSFFAIVLLLTVGFRIYPFYPITFSPAVNAFPSRCRVDFKTGKFVEIKTGMGEGLSRHRLRANQEPQRAGWFVKRMTG